MNAEEMEPGAFKDRFLLEGDPHQMIEGIIASSYAVQAEKAYIFLRPLLIAGGPKSVYEPWDASGNLLGPADLALYDAKNTGRDRVV